MRAMGCRTRFTGAEDLRIEAAPSSRACADFCVNGIRVTAEGVAPQTGWQIGSGLPSN